MYRQCGRKFTSNKSVALEEMMMMMMIMIIIIIIIIIGEREIKELQDGFGGLVVSILATGTQVRGFKPGRSRWIFRGPGKSSVCLPSEGK